MSNTGAAALGLFERKVLRKIFGPVRVGDDYRIRTNRELYELFNNMDVAKRINNGSAGSAMSFGWMKTFLRDECLMRWSAIIKCRDNPVRVKKRPWRTG